MSNVTDLAERVIKAGLVDETRAVIDLLNSTDDAGRAAIAKAAEVMAGRTVDPPTGEITEAPEAAPIMHVTTPKPEAGQLPEALLDRFRQHYGEAGKHQWAIGRDVDDAIVEFAGKFSANKIILAAKKEMDLSRSQILKCQTTWAATDEQLRDEFDMLTFEHFAAVVRHVKDRAQVRKWLALAVETADEYGGRFMPAAKLDAKLRKHLGLMPAEPTEAELLERAIRAVENYQARAADRNHERATKALELLTKINEQ